MVITPEPLRAEAFAPFGDVLEAPPAPGRLFFGDGLANRRSGATPSLAVACVPPLASRPLVATRMERHEFSSQSFIALDVARWLVIVTPKAADGRPDTTRVRAFLAGRDSRRDTRRRFRRTAQGAAHADREWRGPRRR